MKWTKFSLETTTQAVDLVSNMLDELGIEGIEIEDKVPITEEEKKEMFIDILPELGEDDGKATISFYISNDEDKDSILSSVKEGLVELADFVEVGNMEITVSETEDKDWINNWKQYWKPFRVADDIIIKPTWETLEEKNDNDLVIEIDPGTAFGTGSHETTRLCIQGLRKYITDETVLLDVGSGSGILSIIGLKLGAKSALGTDIDPNAIHAMYENAKVNGITEEEFTVKIGNIIDDQTLQEEVGMEKYDIVVANILADVIIPLSSKVGQHMKKGGLYITSGIIYMKRDEVKEAIEKNGFTIVEENEMGEWVSFVARK
ncbi:ribosomal protein L11 methyltransferase [Anaerosporobacter mobilis DSM 15930]|uniref:Ribosomal protein L11 methyltransferase n=1 Tax=Anaerosporobacter mobilis DSM 15930 TaxID=1120996 RepID=A0A1M7K8Z2_9FIRM|nr:50S ribosomal protein L11 methyltransferase [Anaerosporobacter mobilis]SHM61762.1 ribosomal protein L11 methyltransferase [Anaerosporobacter mobilis DSM 15930]